MKKTMMILALGLQSVMFPALSSRPWILGTSSGPTFGGTVRVPEVTIDNWLLAKGMNISPDLRIEIDDVCSIQENLINLFLLGATKKNFTTPRGVQECRIDSNIFNFAESLGQAIKKRDFDFPAMRELMKIYKTKGAGKSDEIILEEFRSNREALSLALRRCAIDHFPEIYEKYLRDSSASADQINEALKSIKRSSTSV